MLFRCACCREALAVVEASTTELTLSCEYCSAKIEDLEKEIEDLEMEEEA